MPKIGEMSVDVRGNVGQFKRAMKEARSAARGFAETVRSRVTLDTKNAGEIVRTTSEQFDFFRSKLSTEHLKRFAGGLMTVTAAVGAAAAAAGAAAAAYSIKAFADLEQIKIGFNRAAGSAEVAKAAFAELEAFAAQTDLQLPDIARAGRNLLFAGVEAKDLTDRLRELGDIASGTEGNVVDLARAYARAKQEGRLTAETIERFGDAAGPIREKLQWMLRVSKEELRQLGEQGKLSFRDLDDAIFHLTKTGSEFGGLLKEQASTVKGVLSTLKDNVDKVAAEVGQALVEGFSMKESTAELIEFIQQVKGPLVAGVKEQIVAFKQAIAASGIEMKDVLTLIQPAAMAIGLAMKLWNTQLRLIMSYLKVVADRMLAAKKAAEDLLGLNKAGSRSKRKESFDVSGRDISKVRARSVEEILRENRRANRQRERDVRSAMAMGGAGGGEPDLFNPN